MIVSGITLHAANIVYQFRAIKELIGDHFRAERISGHQNGLGKIFGTTDDVRSQIELFHDYLLLIGPIAAFIIYEF